MSRWFYEYTPMQLEVSALTLFRISTQEVEHGRMFAHAPNSKKGKLPLNQ